MDSTYVLRGWLSLTVIQALGNALQSLDVQVLAEKLYDLNGKNQVSGLFARLFAQWHILIALIRLLTVFYFDEKFLHILTSLTFCATLAHFGLEVYVFRTISASNVAIVVNVFMAVGSLCFIAFCWNRLCPEYRTNRRFRDNLVSRQNHNTSNEISRLLMDVKKRN